MEKLIPTTSVSASPRKLTCNHSSRRPRIWIGIASCIPVMAGGLWLAGSISADGLRNADYPRTYIEMIELDLSRPNHWVSLTWTGPEAARQNAGPFKSNPGKGLGGNDCNDEAESNRIDSNCTPKGVRYVEGFNSRMPSAPQYKYVTWIDRKRAIGFHSYPTLSDYPASNGCVRLKEYAAHLIHDNSILHKTKIVIRGKWSSPTKR